MITLVLLIMSIIIKCFILTFFIYFMYIVYDNCITYGIKIIPTLIKEIFYNFTLFMKGYVEFITSLFTNK